MRDNQNELLPLVTPDGKVTGSATRGECHGGSKLLHPVVHLHVFNSNGQLYLQLRPKWKDIQPGNGTPQWEDTWITAKKPKTLCAVK